MPFFGLNAMDYKDFQTLKRFPDYATADYDLVISSIRTLDEMISDATTVENAENEDDKQEVDDESMPMPAVACWLEIRELLKC